MSEIRVT